MTGTSVHISTSDDSRAIRLIRRRLWWYFPLLALVSLFGLRGSMGEDSFRTLMYVAILTGLVRTRLSGRAIRMLPVFKGSLATTVWQFSAGYPVAVIAEAHVLHALYWTFFGDTLGHAWDRAVYSFSWFLLFDAVFVVTVARGFARIRSSAASEAGELSPRSTTLAGINVLEFCPLMLLALYCLELPRHYSVPHTIIMALNLIVGGAAFVASYRFRQTLIPEHPRSAEEARRVNTGLIWSTPGRDPWGVALLKHMSGTAVWSSCMAGLTLAICTYMLRLPDYSSEPDSLVGIIIGAAIVNISFIWFPWNAELRAWRMLPLTRAQCGAAIVGFVTVSCLAPWVLVFLVLGSVLASLEFFTFTLLFSLLGLSLVVQGMALVVLPGTLRGPRKGMLLLAVFVVAWMFFVFFFGFLLVTFRESSQTNLTNQGWVWMIAGAMALCAGLPIAARRAERVLRRTDCYQKAME